MAKNAESGIVNRLRKELEKEQCWTLKYSAWVSGATRGVPDVIACISGLFFGIEVKQKRGRLTKIQEHTLNQIIESGGRGVVIWGIDGVDDFMSWLELPNYLWHDDVKVIHFGRKPRTRAC